MYWQSETYSPIESSLDNPLNDGLIGAMMVLIGQNAGFALCIREAHVSFKPRRLYSDFGLGGSGWNSSRQPYSYCNILLALHLSLAATLSLISSDDGSFISLVRDQEQCSDEPEISGCNLSNTIGTMLPYFRCAQRLSCAKSRRLNMQSFRACSCLYIRRASGCCRFKSLTVSAQRMPYLTRYDSFP